MNEPRFIVVYQDPQPPARRWRRWLWRKLGRDRSRVVAAFEPGQVPEQSSVRIRFESSGLFTIEHDE